MKTDFLYNVQTPTFLGCSLQQCWADLAIWEEVLNKVKLGSLIELGTGYCGMATFLLLQCIQRGMEFLTVDIYENSRLDLPLSKHLNLRRYFFKADIFDDAIVPYSIKYMPRPLLLFCDNGDKPKEFNTFVPLLQSGDYVAVHDWGQEIKEGDVEGFSIVPVMKEECEERASLTRFWRIK